MSVPFASAPKLGICVSRCIEAASAAALETALNAFLAGTGTPGITVEKLVQPIQCVAIDATHYLAFIVYAE